MKPFEEQFTAWVDGKLTGADLAAFEKELDTHPEAAAEKDDVLKLGKLLREHPTVPPLGNPDFFNHQLMQRIAVDTPPPRATEKKRFQFWSLPRLAWVGASCLAVAVVLFQTTIPRGPVPVKKSNYFAQVVENWPGNPNVSASTVYSPDNDVTVVWLDGLDYIPATYAIK